MKSAPLVGRGADRNEKIEDQKRSDFRPSRSGPSTTIIATIDKSRSSQLRVSITQWRGQRKIELRELTAVIPGTFFPTSAGVTAPIECLPDLVAAMQAAEAEARRLGWLR
jgi:hypothetical protein